MFFPNSFRPSSIFGTTCLLNFQFFFEKSAKSLTIGRGFFQSWCVSRTLEFCEHIVIGIIRLGFCLSNFESLPYSHKYKTATAKFIQDLLAPAARKEKSPESSFQVAIVAMIRFEYKNFHEEYTTSLFFHNFSNNIDYIGLWHDRTPPNPPSQQTAQLPLT